MLCGNCRREIADYSNFCYFCGARQAVAAPGQQRVAQKRLMRSVTDRKIAGVCGGVADYLEMDSSVVRIIWVLLAIFPIPLSAVLGYLVAWLVMPEAPVVSVAVPASSAAPAAQPNQSV
jgi:phage shock protein C